MNNPSDPKVIDEDRTAYWHEESQTIVIDNSNPDHEGTAFQPEKGKKYYDKFEKEKWKK